MAKRKQVSAKARFEVFERDEFTCQYCGSHPPQAILHVDHIVPVAGGGCNSEDNLITACSRCNGGKGARPLTAIPRPLAEKAKELAEQERQIAGYGKVMQAKMLRLDTETWHVFEVFDPGIEHGFSNANYTSIKLFIERLGFYETCGAMELAVLRKGIASNSTFKYFCGICWRKIKEGDDGQNTLD